MDDLLRSPELAPWLGMALGTAAKGSILLALAWVAARLLARASAAARHLVWTAGVAGLLLLPGLGFLTPAWRSARSPVQQGP